MKYFTAPSLILLTLYLLAVEKFFPILVGGEGFFTHTDMALGKADLMMKHPII